MNPCLRCLKAPRVIDWCQYGDGDEFDFEIRCGCCGAHVRGGQETPWKGLDKTEAMQIWNQRNRLINSDRSAMRFYALAYRQAMNRRALREALYHLLTALMWRQQSR